MKKVAKVIALLVLTTTSFASRAELISRNSIYGMGSITFDSATYAEWIDPWLSIPHSDAAPFPFNNYDDVVQELKPGGKFDGFRFAKQSEVEYLLFTSLGIDPVTAASSITATAADLAAIRNTLNLFDTTFGAGFTSILDARFVDDATGELKRSILAFTAVGPDARANYQFVTDMFADNRADPIGNWLIRVSEPGPILLLLMGIAGLAWRTRKTPLA